MGLPARLGFIYYLLCSQSISSAHSYTRFSISNDDTEVYSGVLDVASFILSIQSQGWKVLTTEWA